MMWSDQTDHVARTRELLAVATPGPWEFATDEGAPVYVQLYATDDAVDEYDADVLSSDSRGLLISEVNADLIAAAPTLLAELVAEVERLREIERTATPDPCRSSGLGDSVGPVLHVGWGRQWRLRQ